MYAYHILNSENIVSGYHISDVELLEVPENYKLLTTFSCVVPQAGSDSAFANNKAVDNNGCADIFSQFGLHLFAKKYNVDTQSYEDYRIPNTQLSKYGFKKRFTIEERVLLAETAKTNTYIAVFQDDLMAAEVIDLVDPDVIGAIDMLVSLNLITQTRRDEILTP